VKPSIGNISDTILDFILKSDEPEFFIYPIRDKDRISNSVDSRLKDFKKPL
jgi:hypothetical protein